MMHSFLAVGLLSCFSAVSADPPTKASLVVEVQHLSQLSTDIVTHINTTAEAQIDEKIAAVDSCWTGKTAVFQKQIQDDYNKKLSQVKLQLENLRQNLPNMNDDQISSLSQQLYVETGGLLEQTENAVNSFNQDVMKIHRQVGALNTIDC
uniref:Uncharacterized protein n=1 Tax=Lygus hesperus TaxID=30085 RepID=A0A146L772_LYGHE